jgi:hypothetical protein
MYLADGLYMLIGRIFFICELLVTLRTIFSRLFFNHLRIAYICRNTGMCVYANLRTSVDHPLNMFAVVISPVYNVPQNYLEVFNCYGSDFSCFDIGFDCWRAFLFTVLCSSFCISLGIRDRFLKILLMFRNFRRDCH